MSRRASSLDFTTVGINRDVDSEYDNVKIVANNINKVIAVANSINNILTTATNIEDIKELSSNVDVLLDISASITLVIEDLELGNDSYIRQVIDNINTIATVASNITAISDIGNNISVVLDAVNQATDAANYAAQALASKQAAEVSETNAAVSATAAATSESNASGSATSAQTSATLAATFASNASDSAGAALTSETAAAASATSAASSESAASTSVTLAAQSAIEAGSSANAAATSATSASSFASAASTSASAANTDALAAASSAEEAFTSALQAAISETNAENSASTASTAATNALNSAEAAALSESAASLSETNALASENSASTSATNAATSESNASTFATNASTSADASSTSATNAANSESAAASSASAASTSASVAALNATNAADSASSASTSASNASTSASNAATSELNANTAKIAAESAQAAAELVFQQFGDQYLGPFANDPTLDNSGNVLTEGDVYWNSTDNVLKFYSGTSWVAPESIASTAATTAVNSATVASNSATAAATSASESATSASEAAASEANAATSETNAATSETNAANSASASATSASASATSAQEAATSASNASTSEINAATSETNAATSETNSNNSATESSNWAITPEDTLVPEGNNVDEYSSLHYSAKAASSASSAASSESAAALSASSASSSEASASTSAANAAISETNASASATSASVSATSALDSANAAASIYDSFDDRYLGAKSTDPALDNDGNTLIVGALYFNTSTNAIKVYDGSAWILISAELADALLTSNNLSDLENIATARSNLGLGTAAITDSTDYATSDEGSLATTAYSWGDHASAGYLTGYTESDPTVPSHVKSITATEKTNWSTAYSWGDHSTEGYLTSYTETDPIFSASEAANITSTDTANWDTAYGWGNHSTEGYLTSYTETDPIFTASASYGISATDISNWNTAYGWGDHSTAGYLTSYTETDPVFSASEAASITSTDTTNWNTAYSWGNHASAGYLTSYTETDPVFIASAASGISSTDITNWGTAYGWGDHSTEGYATTTYVDTSIANLVDSAPATLDTLNELAAALGDDPNFATTVTNSIADRLPLSGGTLTGNLGFGDNQKATFGASGDLEIYHTGTTSYIRDVGDGDLQLFASDDVYIRGYATNNYMARFRETGSVDLYHNNSLKFQTTSTGIDVTGTVTADGLTVDGDSITANAQDAITIEHTGTTGIISSDRTGGNYGLLQFKTTDGTAPKLRQEINYNGDISFYDDTGVSQSFFWDASAESLGIGTSSPSEKLEIFGNALLTTGYKIYGNANTGLTSSYLSLYNAVDGGIDLMANYTTSKITFGTAGSERMRIDSSGNVGIGTTSPAAKLAVVGTTKVGEGVASNTSKLMVNTASGTAAGIQLFQDGVESWIIQNPASTTALTFANSGSERMRIDSSGNVGIGTGSNTIFFPLQVRVGTDQNFFTSNSSGNTTVSALTDAGSSTELRLGGLPLTFSGNGGAGSEHMRIDNAGNVGIGTTNPATALDVAGSISFSSILRSTSGGSAIAPSIQPGNDTDTGIFHPASNNIGFSTARVERMRIVSNGNVGIGTSYPGEKLEVNGTAYIRGGVREYVLFVTSGGFGLNPGLGSIFVHTLSANSTYSFEATWQSGESLTLMIDDGSGYTVTWPTMTWVNNGGAAPTLTTTGYTTVVIWKIGTAFYGAVVGA